MWRSISYYSALAVESLFGVFGIRLYEEPQYDLIDRFGTQIEIRRYGPRLAAEVDLASADEAGRSEAFRLLFAYIAGASRSASAESEKIAMTVPVEVRDKERIAMTVPVQTSKVDGKPKMRFYLPATYRLETAPKPLDDRVRVVMAPGETIATLRFSGSGRDTADRQLALTAGLAGSKWRPAGEPFTLNYDAPFTLPFLRRNEVAVAVEEIS
jgi:hypothetical protein